MIALDTRDWQLLRQTAIFAGLGEDDISAIMERPRVVSRAKGRNLFRRGDPAKAFFIVLSGWVQLYREDARGERTVIHIFGPGESFAEVLIGAGTIYPANADTVTDARLVCIDTEEFRTRLALNPRLGLALISANFRLLKSFVDQIESGRSWTPARRLAQFLLRFAEGDEDGAQVNLPYERGLVAARLGMSAPTFSRVLASLADLGVEADRSVIRIGHVERLSAFVRDGR